MLCHRKWWRGSKNPGSTLGHWSIIPFAVAVGTCLDVIMTITKTVQCSVSCPLQVCKRWGSKKFKTVATSLHQCLIFMDAEINRQMAKMNKMSQQSKVTLIKVLDAIIGQGGIQNTRKSQEINGSIVTLTFVSKMHQNSPASFCTFKIFQG